MALVDALDFFLLITEACRIISILNRFKAFTAYQDPKSGLWYDVPDKQSNPKL
jgi:hypothetical protein